MPEESYRNVDPNHVVPAQCETCPFRKNAIGKYLNPRLAASIEAHVVTRANHLCHQTYPYSETPSAICRGARNYQLQIFHRMGILDAPTDKAYRQALEKFKN